MSNLDVYCERLTSFLAIALLLALLTGCSPARRITVKEAKIIADNRLVEFCNQDKLKVSQFDKPKLLGPKELSGGVNWWFFQYQYIGRRDAKLEIGVSEYGESDIIAIGPGIMGHK
jgi:hypothetical protein